MTTTTKAALPSIEDFLAHTMYLTHCRNIGVQGLTWACLPDDKRADWRRFSAGAFDAWLQMENAMRRARDAGNARGRFVP